MKTSLLAICRWSIRGLPPRFAALAPRIPLRHAGWFALALASGLTPVLAQTPAATAQDPAAANASAAVNTAVPATPASTLEPFGWLHGCWDGKVNQRDFREEWLPLHGDMMIGVSQTVSQGKTQDFEYLRLELRPEGIFYVAVPSGKKESESEIFTFENPLDEFPQRIIYRRGSEGWLYAHVEGKLNGAPRSVIYPMRRVDCTSGELIRQ
ncbi:MAG: hypothetical protein E6H73_07095 [Betaproteobacteria bacterium]|nr:MAG: hypothetical protein E6H73_07095 [Betaproteobacteria bacterium]